jgi:phosphatidylglycerol:prolipoprotein diacylglycerol transferase
MLLEERRPLADLVTVHAWLGHGARLPGGFVASCLLAPLIAAAVRLPCGSFADIAVTAAASLIAIGRLACHFVGCCIGTPSSLPWAISYPRGTVAYAVHLQRGLIDSTATHSLPIHPFGLYMSVAAAAVCACLLYVARVRTPRGTRALLGTTLLGLSFGAIEGIRDGVGNRLPLYRQEMWLILAVAALTALVWLGITSSGIIETPALHRRPLPASPARDR